MKRWTHNPSYRAKIRGKTTATPTEEASDSAEQQIAAWLSELRLLHGVPVHYLVPDQRMLPTESIRFFQVDESWIISLIDGAFSIGSSVAGDAGGNAQLLGRVNEMAVKKTTEVRAKRFLMEVQEGSGEMSGFILRSAVVSGWPNMEVQAFDAADNELTILRLELLSNEIMIGIFDGLVQAIKFREPAETLHFGIIQGTEKATKQLKYVDSGPNGQQPGSIIDGVIVDIPMRDASVDNGVLDIEALQLMIEQTLRNNNGITTTQYSPAVFALEMIQGVQEVDYNIPNA